MNCLLSEQKENQSPFLISSDESLSFAEADKRVNGICISLLNANLKGQRFAIQSENTISYILHLIASWRIAAVPCLISPRYTREQTKICVAQLNCMQAINLRRSIPPSDTSFAEWPAAHANIIFSSGTTADPKAIVHSFGNHLASAEGLNEVIKLDSDDRWLLSLPLYHIGGLAILFRTLRAGSAIVIPDDNASIPKSISEHHVTHCSLVPTQLYRLVNDPALKEPKVILIGGAALNETLFEEAKENGLHIYTSYGSSEMTSTICCSGLNDAKLSSGKLLKNRDLKINDDGEILVKGDCLFQGYVHGGEIVCPLEDGWFRTGDIAELVNDNLHLNGRIDNMFISGGENIHPEEIERCIRNFPGVEEVEVKAEEDSEFGQRPVAYISGTYDKDQLINFLKANIEAYKVPRLKALDS
ncbi:MAG: o-succinylbenzoate--CoA ligase [Lentisphaeria bacterium]|nr:o-succinylbenzoate--CoA ligase [Lentisphaeria bacterium]NQZ66988.1 o-succinylbenzoate--CoA ligase [Lentisphaeria bacterium]